jgi:hypothetical protein
LLERKRHEPVKVGQICSDQDYSRMNPPCAAWISHRKLLASPD